MTNIGNIEAVLSLDASGFNKGLQSSLNALDKFSSSMNRLNSTDVEKSLINLNATLSGLKSTLSPLKTISKELMSGFNSFSLSLSRVSKSLQQLSSFARLSDNELDKLDSVFDKLTQSIVNTYNEIQKLATGDSKLNSVISEFIGLIDRLDDKLRPIDSILKNTANSTQQLGDKSREASNSMDSFSKELSEVNTKLSSIDNSTKSTAKSLGFLGTALRNAFSNAFNRVVSELGKSASETINAKSEMEGYFQMLKLGNGEISNFNKALDETVEKFPRLNKYSLGETISSLGIEFELTTQQMEKAMPIVSMITSEYLRAGRNTSEATLAVKDILQGEFQRLSRETGVKSKDLEDTGLWSPDDPSKNSVTDLLNALEEVGKSRNWDIFVTKANSLNDAVLILQNRFGEWSADMVNAIQPTILGVFNALMDVGGIFGSAMEGVWSWFSSDDISAQISRWTALSMIIGTTALALVHYRTDATLTQMTQMGLTNTIASTILGLNAEKVATYGVTNAIKSRVMGLEVERVKELRVRDAILTKILGLKAEEVAEKGLLNTIKQSIETKKLQQITDEAQELISRNKSIAFIGEATAIDLVKDKETGAILVKEGYTIATTEQGGASLGFVGALKLMILGEVEAEATTLSLSGAIAILTAEMLMNPITWFIGLLTALAGAFYVVSGGLDAHWGKMKQYHETLENSEEVISSHTDYLKKLGEEVGKDSELYKQATDNVKAFNEELGHAKAYEKVLDDKESSLGIDLKSRAELNSKYAGLSSDTSKALSDSIDSTTYGLDNSKRTLEVWNKQLEDFDKSDRTLIKNMQDRGAEEEDILNKREQHTEHYMNFMNHSKEHNESDDWLGGTWAGILAGIDSGQLYLDYKTEDFANWWNDVNKTFANLPQDFSDAINKEGFIPDFGAMWDDWINDAQKSLSDSWTDFTEAWDNNIKKPLTDLWNNFWSFDWLLGGTVSASDGSSDHPSFMEDVSDILGFDVQSWIDNFTSDPLGTLGIELPEFDLLDSLLSGLGFGNNTNDNGGSEKSSPVGTKTIDFSWIPKSIIDSISSYLNNYVGNIDIVGFISNMIPSNVSGIYQWVMDSIINPLVDGVKQGILNTPILGDVAQLLGVGGDTETSSQESGQSVGTNFTTGIQTGLAPLDGIINTAFNGLNLDSITSNFTSNTSTMVTNASSTASSVSTSFSGMKSNHKASVDSMVTNNTDAFRDMQNESRTHMLAMRDSTSNVTTQMTDAWSSMKDSILNSAKKIRDDSKSRFDSLGITIGGFYRKIQNPSLWGGSNGSSTPRRVARNPSVGKALVRGVKPRGYAGGLDSKSSHSSMSISQLKKELCPSGECGNLFDGYKSTDTVNVWDFLQGISGEHGLGGWNFAQSHNTYIKNKSDKWGTAPPIVNLLGGINTSTGFKVGEFNEGTPKVSFSTFEQIATAIFSRIPYRLYFDSSWKGSWLGALQSGACNCYDGALALMALANTFGFRGSMAHGTWTDPNGKKTAHVWAVINGVKMDTTGMQQRGTWRPSASAGGSPSGSSSDKTVNITVDMKGATVYGVEDLDSMIQESVSKGLQAEFNDPYTVAI